MIEENNRQHKTCTKCEGFRESIFYKYNISNEEYEFNKYEKSEKETPQIIQGEDGTIYYSLEDAKKIIEKELKIKEDEIHTTFLKQFQDELNEVTEEQKDCEVPPPSYIC